MERVRRTFSFICLYILNKFNIPYLRKHYLADPCLLRFFLVHCQIFYTLFLNHCIGLSFLKYSFYCVMESEISFDFLISIIVVVVLPMMHEAIHSIIVAGTESFDLHKINM